MEFETAEAPRSQRYLLTALVESVEQLTHLVETVKAAGMSVVKQESLGSRKLTFPIAKKSELELISVFFEADPSLIKAFEDSLKRDQIIKRFLLTKWTVDPNALPAPRRKKIGATI
jgi:ribosomal protein S6